MLWTVLWLSECEASLYTSVFLGRCRCLNGETHFHILQLCGWLCELKTFISFFFFFLEWCSCLNGSLSLCSRIMWMSEWKTCVHDLGLCGWVEDFSSCCRIVWVSELKTGLHVPGVCRCAWKACLHVLGLWMWMKDLFSCSSTVWLWMENLSFLF